MSENINREFLHGQVNDFLESWIERKQIVNEVNGYTTAVRIRMYGAEILRDFIDEQFCVQQTFPGAHNSRNDHVSLNEPVYCPIITRKIYTRNSQQIGTPTPYINQTGYSSLPPDHVYPTK